MDQWITNVNGVVGMGQTPVVVYQDGLSGDKKNGLGNSQKGEVAWLERQGISYVNWDIKDFVKHGANLARNKEAPDLSNMQIHTTESAIDERPDQERKRLEQRLYEMERLALPTALARLRASGVRPASPFPLTACPSTLRILSTTASA